MEIVLPLLGFALFIGACVWVIVRAIGLWTRPRAAMRKFQSERAAAWRADQTWVAQYKDWTHFYSIYDGSFIALDFDRSLIDIGQAGNVKRHGFSDIQSAEISRNTILTTTGIEGLATYSSTTRKTDSSVQLKVSINDQINPYFQVTFYTSVYPIYEQPFQVDVKEMEAQAERFHGLVMTAIAKAKTNPTPSPTPSAHQDEAGGELMRLWELRQAGALTDAEFNAQKAKLLGEA